MIFSIIIPTYNSEKTIRYTLESVKNQNFDKNELEVLIIDGGSEDDTLKIAREYNFCTIYKNEQRLPEYAKVRGFSKAMGKYVVKMDSDEEFASRDALKLRQRAFESFPDVHVLIADKLIHKENEKSTSGQYSNDYGDPFTYFMYRPKETILETFKNNIIDFTDIGVNVCANVLHFNPGDKTPIGDSGTTTIDNEYLMSNFSDYLNVGFISAVTDKIIESTRECLCINDDNVYHHTSLSFKRYLKKIKFRIINNVFQPDDSGFSSRPISRTSRKKYLFIPYAFTLSLLDSVIMSIKNKDIRFMLHTVYSVYTAVQILWNMLLKLMRYNKRTSEY